ncbi:MAG: acyl-CoA dehydrogenase family protein [Nitrososphaerota archaeon]|jgi:alkylation response protein AidB-like acyl-CoA dehydrogenase|nr:acyl-CoA dehydrogenase family protein [Nitrososphaerota archaeon]MDG6916465.1 acyl-CoA dehydrogenase family protein [Nitrososphaerota archaeon]MDG6918820.1 acyl-CoA dehydrogenase family protein [Nitrososphaerota archaeon]MDG6946564.1 acyl-CoA dehydrogenase family protein [Nitrososphaerota archaeon]MDG6947721.1 acyl-CoA dehydrogenase family protein [Nitrososphaerota archaeon]
MENLFQSSVDEVDRLVGLEAEEKRLLQDADAAASELIVSEFESYVERKYNPEIAGVLRRHDLLGVPIDTKYGGRGARQLVEALFLERMGQTGMGVITLADVHMCLGSLAIQDWGNEEQKGRYLPAAAKGDALFAYALTEPEAGSDPASLKTSYAKERGGFRLSGSKYLISNGSIATDMIVFARAEGSAGGVTAFLVDTKQEGFRVDMRLEEKIGLFTSDTSLVSLDGVFVPREDLLGEEGKGLSVAYSALLNGRIGIASGCLGVMEDCLNQVRERVSSRVQHGKEIGRHQLIQKHVACIESSLESCRWLVYRAAMKKDDYGRSPGDLSIRRDADRLSAVAKYASSRCAFESADRAVQCFGGFGYSIMSPVARHFLDSRVARIYEGTDEIMELKIASSILGREFEAYR